MKKFFVDFSGSLFISVPEESTVEDVKIKFFEILNAYNKTHDPQFEFCDIECVEEFEMPPQLTRERK